MIKSQEAETITLSGNRIVESRDGTYVSYTVIGNGPGLIIVPGVMSVAENYSGLAELLSPYFRVYTIERRGRGSSGSQGADYSLQKEVEDILALQGHTLAAYLFGHSYGGLIALEAGLAQSFDKIALYEPGVSVDGSLKKKWLGAYADHLSKAEHLTALALMMQSLGSRYMQLLPLWIIKLVLRGKLSSEKRNQLYQLLPANLNEQKQLGLKDNAYPLYGKIRKPLLLMRGNTRKLPWARKAVNVLKGTIPINHSITFKHLDHFAPVTDPAELVQTIHDFFLQPLSSTLPPRHEPVKSN